MILLSGRIKSSIHLCEKFALGTRDKSFFIWETNAVAQSPSSIDPPSADQCSSLFVTPRCVSCAQCLRNQVPNSVSTDPFASLLRFFGQLDKHPPPCGRAARHRLLPVSRPPCWSATRHTLLCEPATVVCTSLCHYLSFVFFLALRSFPIFGFFLVFPGMSDFFFFE